jgi:hypothetical protein
MVRRKRMMPPVARRFEAAGQAAAPQVDRVALVRIGCYLFLTSAMRKSW